MLDRVMSSWSFLIINGYMMNGGRRIILGTNDRTMMLDNGSFLMMMMALIWVSHQCWSSMLDYWLAGWLATDETSMVASLVAVDHRYGYADCALVVMSQGRFLWLIVRSTKWGYTLRQYPKWDQVGLYRYTLKQLPTYHLFPGNLQIWWHYLRTVGKKKTLESSFAKMATNILPTQGFWSRSCQK